MKAIHDVLAVTQAAIIQRAAARTQTRDLVQGNADIDGLFWQELASASTPMQFLDGRSLGPRRHHFRWINKHTYRIFGKLIGRSHPLR